MKKVLIINTIIAIIGLWGIPALAKDCVLATLADGGKKDLTQCPEEAPYCNNSGFFKEISRCGAESIKPSNRSAAQKPAIQTRCPQGKTLINGKCSDCGETLSPQKPTRPSARTPKPPAGTSAGFSAGDQVPCHISEKGQKYQTCLNESDPQGKGGLWITNIRELLLLRQEIASKCAAAQKMTVAEASKEVSTCLKASVLESLWSFLTHKR